MGSPMEIRDTQERIIFCFKKLVIEKGFEEIRIKDITDLAGLTRPTFYTYFKDKYEVVEQIFLQEIGEVVRPWLERGFTREAFMQFIIQLDKNRDYYQAVVKYEGQNSLGELIETFSIDALRRYMQKNAMFPEYGLYSIDTMARYFGQFLRFIITKYLRSRTNYSFDELIGVYDLLINNSPRQLLDGKAEQGKKE